MGGVSSAGASALPAAPLDAARLRSALGLDAPAAGHPGTIWGDILVFSETGSTNEDVLRRAAAGAPEGLVIAAEEQNAGKGRLGRTWQARPGSALTFSALLRPRSVPSAARGWSPLLAGVAAVRAMRRQTGVDARLKWPNDVLVGAGKVAGILAEQAGDAIVLGIGINVLGRKDDLPVATATSLEEAGASGTDRTDLLAAVLREIEHWYMRWSESAGDAVASGLREQYLSLCTTLGRQVRVQLPAGRVLAGRAADVDAAGQLLVAPALGHDTPGLPSAVRDGGALIAVSAGDVIHVR
jgi:BirA family transcriptional regulator, biotin operon repressor / biotin---[acetyl-CoA-carboxylase] ligase